MATPDLSLQLKNLPHKPGVYLFRDGKGVLLYVGKAKNLKNRVSSYFRTRADTRRHHADARGQSSQTQKLTRSVTPSAVEGPYHITIQPLPSPDLTPAKQLMVSRIRALETAIVSNETEALLLEAELIKRHRPPYNIVLADDKSYVYIKFDFDRRYPDVYPVRRPAMKRDSRALLFGPYTSAASAYTVLKLAKKIFPYCLTPPILSPLRGSRPQRKVSRRPRGHGPASSTESEAESQAVIPAQGESTASFHASGSRILRPCLNRHLHRCPGPCVGAITPEEYEHNLRRMVPLFEGTFTALLHALTTDMKAAAKKKDFETAARLRDQIRALNVVAEKQKVVSRKKESYDVISLAQQDTASLINVFRVRDGVLIERAGYPLTHPSAAPPEELIGSFLQQYYAFAADAPHTVLVPTTVPSPLPARLTLTIPQRGKKRQLLRLGKENAEEELKRFANLQSLKRSHTNEALISLMKLLSLGKLPARIEAYDISNIQGRHAVGVMTVLIHGVPSPRDYRSFTIKTVQSSNDVAMIREILHRRFAHSIQKINTSVKQGIKKSIDAATDKLKPDKLITDRWPLPDLVVVDGGKPQLAAAQHVVHEYGLALPLLGIAKGRGLETRARKQRGEELWYLPLQKQENPAAESRARGPRYGAGKKSNNQARENARPEKLPTDKLKTDHAALLLLDRVRDEAHRFGITRYRARHRRALTATRLDDIPGGGSATRRLLLRAFGSLDAALRAPHDELVRQVGEKRANAIGRLTPPDTRMLPSF